MRKKRILLEDGRYLIYYTFDKPGSRQGGDVKAKQEDARNCGGNKQCRN